MPRRSRAWRRRRVFAHAHRVRVRNRWIVDHRLDIAVAQHRPVAEHEALDVGRNLRTEPGVETHLSVRTRNIHKKIAKNVAGDHEVLAADVVAKNHGVDIARILLKLEYQVMPAGAIEEIGVASG